MGNILLDTFRTVARRSADWVDMHYQWQQVLLKKAAPHAHGKLLDVGCGSKPHQHFFRSFVDEYVGIEHEAAFTLTSASNAENRPDFLYDGEVLPFAEASFDTILSVDVLEHTPSPARLVAEMARVLRPGGTLILTAPFSFRRHELPHDYFRYTPEGLRFLCDEVGIDVFETHPFGSLPSLLAHKTNTYLGMNIAHLDGLGQSLGKFGHESNRVTPPRWWTVPFVVPAMFATAASARALEMVVKDPTESLGHLILGKRRTPGRA